MILRLVFRREIWSMDHEVALQLSAFNKLYKELDELYHDFAKHCGISDCAFWILYSVQESVEPYTQKDLSEIWSFSRQTVNSALKNLEADDYIELVPLPGNRKNKEIVLTQKGKNYAEEHVMPLMEAEQNAFGKLTDEERSEFLRLTQKHISLLRTETNAILES